MAETRTFDVIVIGGGSAGENVAGYAREHGLSVALVESELVGGECSYWACMPSKALLRPTEVLAAARRVPAARPAVTGDVDVAATLKSRNAFASNWDDEPQVRWVESTGTELLRGHARLAGPRTVEVSPGGDPTVRLTAERAVVVATGTAAAMPPIAGLDDAGVWDSREVTTTEEVPRRLVVVGGGVVGAEMAQAHRRLGAEEVTIIEIEERIFAVEEPFVGEELGKVFVDEGIDIRTSTTAESVVREADGTVRVTLSDGSEIVADEILVSTGRRPRTDDLGLDSVGLEPGGYLEVDGQLRVTGVDGSWLYAVGDVNGRALFTHQGKYQARLVGDILGGVEGLEAFADDRAVPRVAFTDPQVAAVGLIEQQARDAGLDVRTVSHAVGATAGGALHGQNTPGTAKIVIDNDRDVIVGATFTGPGVGEMVHAATIAIVGEVPLSQLWHAVPAFPTISEVWLRLLEIDRGGS